MFVSDWIKHQMLIDKAVTVPYKSEWMRGAVTDFTFNKGIGNVTSSTMLKNLNNKNYDAACFQLTKWVYGTINGKKVILKGLNIRAQAQYKYCMGYEPSEYKSFYQQWN
jgi:lysozyme